MADFTAKDKDYFLSLLKDLCVGYGIDFSVMAAICEHESSWNTYAIRYERGWPYVSNSKNMAVLNGISQATEEVLQQTSWGLGQIMGGTARGLGWKGPLVRLCEPEIGLDYACKYFKKNCDRFPSIDKKLAAYNAGTPDLSKQKCKDYVAAVKPLIANFKI